MIKITPFLNKEGSYCKNCGRVTPLMLMCYIDGADDFNKKFSLCEDCSNNVVIPMVTSVNIDKIPKLGKISKNEGDKSYILS